MVQTGHTYTLSHVAQDRTKRREIMKHAFDMHQPALNPWSKEELEQAYSLAFSILQGFWG